MSEDQEDLNEMDMAILHILVKAGRPLTHEEIIAELERGEWDLATVH